MTVRSLNVVVDSVKRHQGIRLVTLHLSRTLSDGRMWEELSPFAVVDQVSPGSRLVAGMVIPVDREAVESGEVPEELLSSSEVAAVDDSVLPRGAETDSSPADDAQAADTMPLSDAASDRAGARDGPVGSSSVSATGLSYADRSKARDYALTYALNPNRDYHEWGNDCTNFVSPSMRAGGWTYDRGWYRSDGNRWYTGNWLVRASWTWTGAENFYRFARVESKRAEVWTNVHFLRIGDILQDKLEGSSAMNHSMVTTGHSNGVPLLSYHTNNTKNKPFTSMTLTGYIWFAHKV